MLDESLTSTPNINNVKSYPTHTEALNLCNIPNYDPSH